MDDDLALLDRWRAGDNAAGHVLFERHFASVFGFFETKCPSEAEELTQSTFLACVRAKEQFRKASTFRTYLFAIARNELHHWLRTRARKYDKLDFELSSIADLTSSAGTKLARVQEHHALVEALQRLPVDQQMLLELHYWEDQDVAALAEVFDAPAATIRTRLHRARNALRECLAGVAPHDPLASDDNLDRWVGAQRKPASA
jgi:RNA polymerase sigma-70 factor (ECF subfamily)